jgi:glycosyltransferase involved in cell wall biosynthesis
MNPKVSIIIPCYNASLFIDELVASLKSMTFVDWECIFIINGSTDDTINKLEALKIDDRFIIVTTEQNGVSNARNIGLKQAKGKYIQFLDVDDFLQNNKISSHVEFLENNNSIDVVFSGALYFENNNLEDAYIASWSIKAPVRELDGDADFTYLKLLEGNRLVISGPMFRRNLSAINNGFLENLNYNEDWEFWLRLSRNDARFKFVEPEDSKSLIRIHASNCSKNLNGMYSSELLIYKSIIADKNSKELHLKIAKKYYLRTWLEIIKRQLKGDAINVLKIYKTLKSTSLLKLQ